MAGLPSPPVPPLLVAAAAAAASWSPLTRVPRASSPPRARYSQTHAVRCIPSARARRRREPPALLLAAAVPLVLGRLLNPPARAHASPSPCRTAGLPDSLTSGPRGAGCGRRDPLAREPPPGPARARPRTRSPPSPVPPPPRSPPRLARPRKASPAPAEAPPRTPPALFPPPTPPPRPQPHRLAATPPPPATPGVPPPPIFRSRAALRSRENCGARSPSAAPAAICPLPGSPAPLRRPSRLYRATYRRQPPPEIAAETPPSPITPLNTAPNGCSQTILCPPPPLPPPTRPSGSASPLSPVQPRENLVV